MAIEAAQFARDNNDNTYSFCALYVTSMILNAKYLLTHLIFMKPSEPCTIGIPIILIGKLKNRTVKYFAHGHTAYTPRVRLDLSHSVHRVSALDYYNSTSFLCKIILCECFPGTKSSCDERNNGLGIWKFNFSM